MNNLPSDFAHPGGFVESYMNYVNETAVCEQPLFALASALALAGTLYGQHFQTVDGQRTNLFCMAVGYTSCGKGHPLAMLSRVLDDCGATYLRLGQVTSDSAIEWALKQQSRFCFLIDEAGHYFSGVSDSVAASSAQHAIKPALLELWSAAGGSWKGKQRVPRDGKSEQPPIVVRNPHLCLYATTQPQILFESLSRNDLRDGWLPRNLFFISKTRPKPVAKPITPIPNDVRLEVLRWKNAPEGVITVPITPEANAIFNDFTDQIYKKMMIADKTGDETNYLYGKARENAGRMALILAVSRRGTDAVIGTEEAQYATKLVHYLINEMIRVVRENVSESPAEKDKKRILQIIAQTGGAGILKGELTRRTQFIRRALRDEYIQDLVESGEIMATSASNGGERYRICDIV
ncbi:MAG: DUF3987 domain-containing protein [Kiritimatiellae bacterium]|nr:DUF3987 domain-containing protein [Kiritimatiellia bacterium]